MRAVVGRGVGERERAGLRRHDAEHLARAREHGHGAGQVERGHGHRVAVVEHAVQDVQPGVADEGALVGALQRRGGQHDVARGQREPPGVPAVLVVLRDPDDVVRLGQGVDVVDDDGAEELALALAEPGVLAVVPVGVDVVHHDAQRAVDVAAVLHLRRELAVVAREALERGAAHEEDAAAEEGQRVGRVLRGLQQPEPLGVRQHPLAPRRAVERPPAHAQPAYEQAARRRRAQQQQEEREPH